jgi:isopenicillin-N epimerase
MTTLEKPSPLQGSGAAPPAWGRAMRPLWAFDPDMVFLNQGAFGATLRSLMEVQTAWRSRMEMQTARFFMGELPALVRAAVAPLAAFVGADPERTVMVENASSGIMAVLVSLDLKPGERVITTSHVYGAVRHALRHVAARTGAEIVEVPVPLPVSSPQDFLGALAAAIDARTRLVLVDHVASPSALILPVAEIVAMARAAGAVALIDGAHGPGMIDLDLTALDADYYVGNCHKWMCNPKGAGFIVLGRAAAAEGRLHPLTISHAYGQGFVAEFGKIGTRDPSPWLTVPDAVAAHRVMGGAALRARNTDLARTGAAAIATRLGTGLAGPAQMFAAMVSLRLPDAFGPATPAAAAALREALWQRGRIEALVLPFCGALWLRLCAFAYTEPADFDAVSDTLDRIAADGAGGAA